MHFRGGRCSKSLCLDRTTGLKKNEPQYSACFHDS